VITANALFIDKGDSVNGNNRLPTSTWHGFQGCFIAVAQYVISFLVGIATYYFMKSLTFPLFVVWTTAIIMGMLSFQIIYIVRTKIGERDEQE
jgi:hypothetical protein